MIKIIENDGFEKALFFAWGVFQDYEAPDYIQEGADAFLCSDMSD